MINNSKTEIRKMTLEDIEQAAQISTDSFDEHHIIAYKMGKKYLQEVFFPAIVKGSVSGAIAAFQDGKMLGYLCYISDFPQFHRELRNKKFFQNVYYTFVALIKFRLSLKDLYNVLIGLKWVNKQAAGIKATVGPLAVSPEIKGTQTGGLVAFLLMRTVFEKFRSEGVECIWATVDSRNHSSLRFGEALGFKEKSSIQLWGIRDIFRIKELNE